eukprot:g9869.t1
MNAKTTENCTVTSSPLTQSPFSPGRGKDLILDQTEMAIFSSALEKSARKIKRKIRFDFASKFSKNLAFCRAERRRWHQERKSQEGSCLCTVADFLETDTL